MVSGSQISHKSPSAADRKTRWALAAIGSAAFTGTTNTTASAEDVSEAASGVTLAQKTLDEVYDFHTDACGGGILWTRNPAAKNNYKSSITQLLFLSLSARTHLITGNQTILQQAEDMMSWLLASKVVDLEAGVVNDGIDALSCGIVTTQWTYNYGVSIFVVIFGRGNQNLIRTLGLTWKPSMAISSDKQRYLPNVCSYLPPTLNRPLCNRRNRQRAMRNRRLLRPRPTNFQGHLSPQPRLFIRHHRHQSADQLLHLQRRLSAKPNPERGAKISPSSRRKLRFSVELPGAMGRRKQTNLSNISLSSKYRSCFSRAGRRSNCPSRSRSCTTSCPGLSIRCSICLSKFHFFHKDDNDFLHSGSVDCLANGSTSCRLRIFHRFRDCYCW